LSPQAAQFKPAIWALYGMVVNGPGWIELKCQRPGEQIISHHHPIRRGGAARLAETVQRFDERFSDEIHMRLPVTRKGHGTVSESRVLWARIEGTDSYERAKRFTPRPTLVLQEGASSRRLLLWGLWDAVSWERCGILNRRLAYLFGAVQKHGDPDTLEIPMPGTCLRVGRLTTDLFEAEAVAGGLKDPPPADAWLKGTA
jgi:hypothetical protein